MSQHDSDSQIFVPNLLMLEMLYVGSFPRHFEGQTALRHHWPTTTLNSSVLYNHPSLHTKATLNICCQNAPLLTTESSRVKQILDLY